MSMAMLARNRLRTEVPIPYIYIYIWPIINGLREYPQNIWPEIWYYVTCEVYIWRKMGIFVHSELLVYPRLIVKKWGYRWI